MADAEAEVRALWERYYQAVAALTRRLRTRQIRPGDVRVVAAQAQGWRKLALERVAQLDPWEEERAWVWELTRWLKETDEAVSGELAAAWRSFPRGDEVYGGS